VTVPRLSDDGLLVAFEAYDGSLVPNDSNKSFDVFVRDLATPATELISQHDPALPSVTPNGPSTLSLLSVSADGRFVAFASEADNLLANDTNGIVVITQIRPISVLFNLPQQQFPQVSAAFAKGPLPVDAMAVDGKTFVDRGTLRVIDNQMDQTTGTIRMKAEFPNANLQLWPGQFINIRLLVDTLKQVVVVPTAAVQRGPQGTFVYVVGDDSKVAVRTVTVARQDDTKAVISDGVKTQEQVVTTGFTRLSNGTRVAVQQGAGEPQPAAGEGATPQGPEGRRKREGADNTDGKERRRTDNAPSVPSTKQ